MVDNRTQEEKTAARLAWEAKHLPKRSQAPHAPPSVPAQRRTAVRQPQAGPAITPSRSGAAEPSAAPACAERESFSEGVSKAAAGGFIATALAHWLGW